MALKIQFRFCVSCGREAGHWYEDGGQKKITVFVPGDVRCVHCLEMAAAQNGADELAPAVKPAEPMAAQSARAAVKPLRPQPRRQPTRSSGERRGPQRPQPPAAKPAPVVASVPVANKPEDQPPVVAAVEPPVPAEPKPADQPTPISVQAPVAVEPVKPTLPSMPAEPKGEDHLSPIQRKFRAMQDWFISILNGEGTEEQVPGVRSDACEGSTKRDGWGLKCQFPGCDCGMARVGWADTRVVQIKDRRTGQAREESRSKLFFFRVEVTRKDSFEADRAFIGCFNAVKAAAVAAEELGRPIVFRPVNECRLFVDKEPAGFTPARVIRNGNGNGSGAASKPLTHKMPPPLVAAEAPSATVVMRKCSASGVEGDPGFKLEIPPLCSLITTHEVWEQIGPLSERRRTLTGTHLLDGRQWRQLAADEKKAVVEHTRDCLVHGSEFRAIGSVLFALFNRGKELDPDFNKNKPKTESKPTVSVGALTCLGCNRRVNRLYDGDAAVDTVAALEERGCRETARCGRCKKAERKGHKSARREANLAARRAADAAEMGRQHKVGVRGDDTNRKWKKEGKNGKDK